MSKEKSRLSPFVKQCFVTLAIGSNTIGHGCMVGFPGVLSPQLHKKDSQIPITTQGDSWIASVMGIALVIGSFLMPPIMGKLGRKKAHCAVTMPIIVGWMILIMSSSVEVLIIGRLVQGISFGMMLPLRSVLIGEYTSPKNRGAFLTTVSAAQGFGVFFVHLLGSLCTWKTTAILCLFFPILSLAMIFYSPESPSWLADKGRHEECEKVFRWLRGNDEEEELKRMIESKLLLNSTERVNKFADLVNIVKLKEFYKPIVIMVHIYFMGEFSGGALLACYSTQVLEFITGSDKNANFWMVELDTQRIISNLLAIYIVHKLRRRTMFIFTGTLCISCHLAVAVYVLLRSSNILLYDAIWLPITLINIQYFTVATGMICLPYVIAGEIFPMQYRSFGGSFSILSIACGYFVVTKTFTALTDAIGFHGTYFVYAGVLTYCLLVVGFLLPETKGKTLQEIEDEFKGNKERDDDIELKQHINEENGNCKN